MADSYQDVTFGQSAQIQIRLEKIMQDFICVCYGEIIKEGNKIVDFIPMTPDAYQKLPDSQGYLSGDTLGNPSTTGGIKTFVEMFVRTVYKILGFYPEQYVKVLGSMASLVGTFVFNGDPNNKFGNDTTLPHTMFVVKKALTDPVGAAKTGIEIGKDITSQMADIGVVLAAIIKAITDLKGFVTEMLVGVGKPLENFTVPVPPFPLGFAGVKLPEIDKNKLFTNPESPLFFPPGLNLGKLIQDPLGELKKTFPSLDLSGVPDPNTTQDLVVPPFDLSEVYWYQDTPKYPQRIYDMITLTPDRFLQVNYKEPYVVEEQFTFQFDYFRIFPLDQNQGLEKGLWDCIREADLDQDPVFVGSFYQLLRSQDWNKRPEVLQRYFQENFDIFHRPKNWEEWLSSSVTFVNGDPVYPGNDSDSFRKLLEKLFQFNFFNYTHFRKDGENFQVDNSNWVEETGTQLLDGYVYPLGNTLTYTNGNTDKQKGHTRWNYKKFTLNFLKLVPRQKCGPFITHLDEYILDFSGVTDLKAGITADFSQILKYSSYREYSTVAPAGIEVDSGGSDNKKGGCKSASNGANATKDSDTPADANTPVMFTSGNLIKIFGPLNDNDYRVQVDLKPLSPGEPLLGDNYDTRTGMANFVPANFSQLLDKIKGQVPEIVSFVLSMVDTMRQLIMFPINMLLSYLEKVLCIIKDLLKLNIPGAIKKMVDLAKSMMPGLDFFQQLVLTNINPLIQPLILKIKKANLDLKLDFKEFVQPFLDKMIIIITQGVPKLLLNIIMELFCYILRTVQKIIPIPIPICEGQFPDIMVSLTQLNFDMQKGGGNSPEAAFNPESEGNQDLWWYMFGQYFAAGSEDIMEPPVPDNPANTGSTTADIGSTLDQASAVLGIDLGPTTNTGGGTTGGGTSGGDTTLQDPGTTTEENGGDSFGPKPGIYGFMSIPNSNNPVNFKGNIPWFNDSYQAKVGEEITFTETVIGNVYALTDEPYYWSFNSATEAGTSNSTGVGKDITIVYKTPGVYYITLNVLIESIANTYMRMKKVTVT